MNEPGESMRFTCRHCKRPFTQVGVLRHCPTLRCDWCMDCVNKRRAECGLDVQKPLGRLSD